MGVRWKVRARSGQLGNNGTQTIDVLFFPYGYYITYTSNNPIYESGNDLSLFVKARKLYT